MKHLSRRLTANILTALLFISSQPPTLATELELVLTVDSVSNLDGGVSQGNDMLANLDLTGRIKGSEFGFDDASEIFFYVLGNYGEDPSETIGDIQATDNIEANNTAKVYEFWYRRNFGNSDNGVLFGLHDYNSAFYALEYSGLFINSSFGIGIDVAQVGPSIFNTTALGIVGNVDFDGQYLLAATYDGVPGDPEKPKGTRIKINGDDGLFSAAEWGIVGGDKTYYKFAVGLWHHSAKTENPITAQTMDSNYGYYFLAEKALSTNWGAFLQLGFADSEKNIVARYQGAGIVRQNWLREFDSVGLAIGRAENSTTFRDLNSGIANAELAVELSYNLPITEYFSIQPDLQYIKTPGFNKTLENALVFSLRAQFSHAF